jgi:hypothetical protein
MEANLIEVVMIEWEKLDIRKIDRLIMTMLKQLPELKTLKGKPLGY